MPSGTQLRKKMSNTTLYYTALEDMFKDLLVDASQEGSDQENGEASLLTPKRFVRLRKQNLFAKESNFVICRRSPPAAQSQSQLQLSPSSEELRKELKRNECLRLRQQRVELERNKAAKPQRLTLRI